MIHHKKPISEVWTFIMYVYLFLVLVVWTFLLPVILVTSSVTWLLDFLSKVSLRLAVKIDRKTGV